MKKAWNIKGKNPQQNAAIKALLDPQIDLVILEGTAGAGKTLLAIAAGLEQVLETKMYNEIIFTRAPVGVGFDMGHLPGDEKDKMGPWCAGLHDNIEYLVGDFKLTESIIETKVKIKAMLYMRGRSLMRRYVIIDEIQNMSAQELKVLITRAGEDTKIVCMGDLSQIDNRKLNRDNNALSALVAAQEYTQAEFVKYIQLPKGERSRLCEWGSVAL